MKRGKWTYLMSLGALALIAMMTLAPQGYAADGSPEKQLIVEINKGKLLRMSAPATAVMVADPNIADVQVVSPTLVYVNGRSVGETTIFAVDAEDRELLHSVVSVTHNISKLKQTLKAVLPTAEVDFDSVDGALVVKGNVSSPLEAESVRQLATPFLQGDQALVNLLHTSGSDQVTLQVKVAEVSRSELKRFGIHLESLLTSGNFLFGLANGRDFIDASGTLLRSGLDNSIFIGHNSNNGNVNGVIDALADDGLATVLAEPNLTAMSGQPASFLAGGEFPIPVVGDEGSVTIEYRPFGVSLAFTPTVLSKDKIMLSVTPEVSTLSTQGQVQAAGFNIPSIATRRATTSVELGSGQTFAIAGLIRHDTSNDISKFPGLGDLPILGMLFRSTEFRNEQSELVILVTPYIVTGVDEKKQMAAPTDGYMPPTDIERVLFGKLYKERKEMPIDRQRKAEEMALFSEDYPRLHGPVGYILK